MAYRRDRKGRRATRLLIATALSVTPVIHGCAAEEPDDDRSAEIDGGNPKGSFYDEGLVDAEPDMPVVISNPKGSLYDEGLVDPDADPADGAGGSDGAPEDGGADGVVDGGDGGPDAGPDDGTGGAGGAGGGGG